MEPPWGGGTKVYINSLGYMIKMITTPIYSKNLWGPQGFWGSGEKGYLFSGSWGALLIILGELGSKHILLGIKGALPKTKKNKYQASILSDSLKCRWLLGAIAPRPPYTNVISFKFHYISFQINHV